MTAQRDAPCVEPVRDTWGTWSSAASWLWTPRTRPAGSDDAALNAWGADQLVALCEALRPIARLRELSCNTLPDVTVAVPPCAWAPGQAHDAFERDAIAAVRHREVPLSTLDAALDLHAWVRTAASPAAPVRGWVCPGMWASIHIELDDPYGALNLHHTLFFGGALHGAPNTELYQRNSPLLRDAIAAIEAALGPITETSGLPGVTRDGIAPVD